jgi:hypothetical protein
MSENIEPSIAGPKLDDPRIRCFERHSDEESFNASLMKLLSRMQEETRKMFVSEHNVLRLNHGRSWVHAARDPEPDTSMLTISTEWTIPFKAITDNDLGLISRTILPINEEMEKQFSQNMYGVIGAAAERVGNVVNVQDAGSFAHAMLGMLRKIELAVGRDGTISMPQLHVSPEFYARLPDEMSKVTPEMEAEIGHVKSDKVREAIDRETARKAKFKTAAA